MTGVDLILVSSTIVLQEPEQNEQTSTTPKYNAVTYGVMYAYHQLVEGGESSEIIDKKEYNPVYDKAKGYKFPLHPFKCGWARKLIVW